MRPRSGKARKSSASRSATSSGPRSRRNTMLVRSACCARSMPRSPTSGISTWFWPRWVVSRDCAPRYLFPVILESAPMQTPTYKTALIVGAGEGLSASLARLLAKEKIRVALAARKIEKLGALCTETGARAFACDASNADDVERLFGQVERDIATPDLVVYNASGRARGPFTELVPADVANAIAVSAFGGFLVAQQAVKRMLPNKHGAILFTGASASVKGYAQSAPFAMGKFALRGLAQSMARELSPQGIHIAHFVIH